MKKSIYILTLFCMLAIPAFAQKGLHIGANAGIRGIGLIDDVKYGDVDYKYKLTLGPSYGITGGYNFNSFLGVKAELDFANNGQMVAITENGVTTNKRISLSYMQIPLMLHISGGDFKTRFTADFGPQWSILTNANIIVDDPKLGEVSVPSTARFNSTDFGLVLQGGGEVTLVSGLYMDAGLRFYYGMQQINKDPNVILDRADAKDNLSNAFAGVYVGLNYLFH